MPVNISIPIPTRGPFTKCLPLQDILARIHIDLWSYVVWSAFRNQPTAPFLFPKTMTVMPQISHPFHMARTSPAFPLLMATSRIHAFLKRYPEYRMWSKCWYSMSSCGRSGEKRRAEAATVMRPTNHRAHMNASQWSFIKRRMPTGVSNVWSLCSLGQLG